MKKFLSLLSFVGIMALAGCCCKDKKSTSKKSKASHHKVMKKSAHTKKSGPVKSELDKIWCDICGMWTGKGHKH